MFNAVKWQPVPELSSDKKYLKASIPLMLALDKAEIKIGWMA